MDHTQLECVIREDRLIQLFAVAAVFPHLQTDDGFIIKGEFENGFYLVESKQVFQPQKISRRVFAVPESGFPFTVNQIVADHPRGNGKALRERIAALRQTRGDNRP